MKKITSVLIIMLSCLLILSGCTGDNIVNSGQNVNDGSYTTSVESPQIQDEEKGPEAKSNKFEQITFDYKDIPQYSGEPYVVVPALFCLDEGVLVSELPYGFELSFALLSPLL